MYCQLNSYTLSIGISTPASPSIYQTPMAICTIIDYNSAVGYCRHPMMCNGNCETYALIKNGLMIPLSVSCDPGWLTPDCTKRCTQVDSFGFCTTHLTTLDVVDGSAQGLSIANSNNGGWCQILKYFQAAPALTPSGGTL